MKKINMYILVDLSDNDDGIVNLKDLIYVLKVLAMYSEEDLNIWKLYPIQIVW